MTETQAAMTFYRDILIIMGLILFIANQAGVLYRGLYQDMIVRRVRRRLRPQYQKIKSPGIVQAAEKRTKELTKWPTFGFKWWWVPVGILAAIIIAAFGYIFFGYDPNPMR